MVKRDKVEKVERDVQRLVDRDDVSEVTRDRSRKVGGKEMIEIQGTRSLAVKGDAHEAYKANHSEEVGQGLYVKAMNVVVEGMSELTLKVGGSFVKLDSGGVTIVGSMIKLNSGGAAGQGTMCGAVPARSPLQAAPAASVTDGAVQQGVPDNRPTYKQPANPPPKTSWVELELVDEAGKPVPGEAYEVELPDGKIATGTTGADGTARISGFDPGTCKIRFPNLDKEAWEKI